MPRKKWHIQTADPVAVEKLAERLKLPMAIAQVVVDRGFASIPEVEAFFHPQLASLSDPFALPDMKAAVERIWNAIDAGESIAVFGDYDVDGITSTALLFRILSGLGAKVQSFVPDRIDEGYGLSLDAMERCLAELDPALLISVDCGTNSIESVRLAGTRGVDVIVTDHHEPGEETAPAFALINPKLGDCGEILSGVGVAFKLAHALIKTGRSQSRASAARFDLRKYLDIVALGTVADIVPLVGENRIIVRHGLAQLNASQWAGMEALKDVASIKGEANTGQLGFQLGPRINAAGRIGEPMQAVRLLTTDDPLEARNIAKLLDRTNQERRAIERKMANDAFAEIDRHYNPEKHFGLVVAREGWHPGVVGIVASRVSRHYNRPSIILGIDADGSARGSCRGIAEFDLLAGLQACEAYLDTYGGHKMAAGLALKPHVLDAFRLAFNAVAADMLSAVDLTPVQRVDAIVNAAELDWNFYELLRQLRPFGQDNPEPIWALLGARVIGAPRVVGQHHLKLTLGIEQYTFEAIAFNYPRESLPAGKIDVAFMLQENSWNGNTSLQLQVQDIRPAK
jgi:single-stranded-DNA-specific exonuclease